MATVSPAGLTPLDLEGYRALLETRFRSAFGTDLSVAPETPQGQIIGILALSFAEADEALVHIANGLSVWTAAGVQLDDIGSLLSVEREPETFSLVELTLTGTEGVTVPPASRVRSADGLTAWSTITNTVIAAGGTNAFAIALTPGPVLAEAGTLTTIATAVPGWETVTNAAAAQPGLPVQADAEYRRLYAFRTARKGVTPRDSLKAALIEHQAAQVEIYENNTAAVAVKKSLALPPHTMAVVVAGGTSNDIADEVYDSKTLGTGVMTSFRGGAHDLLATIIAVSDGSLTFRTKTATGIDLTAATTFDEAAKAISDALQASADLSDFNVVYDGERFVVLYGLGKELSVGSTTLGGNLGLDDGVASGFPFLRPRESTLTLTVAVTRVAGYPADGLERINAAVLAVNYGIGENARRNDFIRAVEGIPGSHVTAVTLTSARATISDTPADVRHTIYANNVTVTLS